MLTRLLQRSIGIDEVVYALNSGDIIEEYPTDYPYPSCLVLGVTEQKKHLHVVCGIGIAEIWLITAYYPGLDEWEVDLRNRKEKGK